MSQKEHKIFEKLPFEVVDTDLQENYQPTRNLVQVGPKKYMMSSLYKEYGLDIYNFTARQDDVYLMGFVRSGTTLHSEMVWQIVNDLNYKEAAKSFMDYRFPHIDYSIMPIEGKIKKAASQKDVSDELKEVARKYEEVSLKGLANKKGRRLIKSHLPISLMPPHIFQVGAKIIYCARNPRDMLVSMYKASFFFQRSMEEEFTIRRYFEGYKNNVEWLCPYFEHVKEAWARRNDENFLFLFYEDTIKDMKQAIVKVANFLGKKLTNDQVASLADHLSFENFKNNKSVNCDHLVRIGIASKAENFIRQGKTGSWRDYFEGDLEREVDEWIEENLRDTDLRFPKT